MSDNEFDQFLGDELSGIIPEHLTDDTYLCELVECKRTQSKPKTNDPNEVCKSWSIFNWEVIQDGPYAGEEIVEIYRSATLEEFNNASAKEKKTIKDAHRKRSARLESLGVPAAEINSVRGSDLVGTKAYLTVKVRPKQGTGFNIWVESLTLATSVSDSLLSDFDI